MEKLKFELDEFYRNKLKNSALRINLNKNYDYKKFIIIILNLYN